MLKKNKWKKKLFLIPMKIFLYQKQVNQIFFCIFMFQYESYFSIEKYCILNQKYNNLLYEQWICSVVTHSIGFKLSQYFSVQHVKKNHKTAESITVTQNQPLPKEHIPNRTTVCSSEFWFT